jgi:hypothetical protein
MMNIYLGRVPQSVGTILHSAPIQKGTRVLKSATALAGLPMISNRHRFGRFAGLGSGASVYALAEALRRFKKDFETSDDESAIFSAAYEDLEDETDLNVEKLMLSELSILCSLETDRVSGDPRFEFDCIDDDGMYFHFADTDFFVEMKRQTLVFNLEK